MPPPSCGWHESPKELTPPAKGDVCEQHAYFALAPGDLTLTDRLISKAVCGTERQTALRSPFD
jgi:hypothetical protein